jgi:hypothetical protein
MAEDARFAIVLSREIMDELDSQAMSIEEEIRRKDPNVQITHEGLGGATKDAATIITATAALAPLVVPILTSLIRRIFPRRDIEVEEMMLPDGTQWRKLSVKER